MAFYHWKCEHEENSERLSKNKASKACYMWIGSRIHFELDHNSEGNPHRGFYWDTIWALGHHKSEQGQALRSLRSYSKRLLRSMFIDDFDITCVRSPFPWEEVAFLLVSASSYFDIRGVWVHLG